MAKIYLKGHGKPITVSRMTAVRINEKWLDDNILPQEYIIHPDFSTEKGNIKAIIIADEDDDKSDKGLAVAKDNDEYYEKLNREYNDYIRRRCDMPIEEKINDVRLYSMIYRATTNQAPTSEFLQEVRDRQRTFFMKYPRHPYASINVSDILPKTLCDTETIQGMIPSMTIRRVYHIIREANNTARFMNKL